MRAFEQALNGQTSIRPSASTLSLIAMASYYNPSKRLSEWAAAALSPFIQLETQDGQTDQSRLSVGLWSGHIQLKNVELRPEAFDKFLNPNDTEYNEYGVKIRWKIVRGTIENVSIDIPWKGLLVGTSYSGVRRENQKNTSGGQSELHQSTQRQDFDLAETGSCADQQGIVCKCCYGLLNRKELFILTHLNFCNLILCSPREGANLSPSPRSR